jgi:hypothetical protein
MLLSAGAAPTLHLIDARSARELARQAGAADVLELFTRRV